jgi:hypothetical protein
MTDDLIRREMQLVKDVGANFIRLGHYQQSRLVLDLCDELGILVWEEVPWCRGGVGGDPVPRAGQTHAAQPDRSAPQPSRRGSSGGWAMRTTGPAISKPSTRPPSAPTCRS